MKFKNLACVMLVVTGMASCTAESDAPVNDETSIVLLERTFNARSVDNPENDKNSPNLSELVPVSAEEAKSILTTLRERKNVQTQQSLDSRDGNSGQKFLTITTRQCVDSRHTLTLQLGMMVYEDDGSLYYKDYQAFASSSLYIWHMNGFSLSSGNAEGMYKFEGNSYLYFKIADEGETYIQVPVKVTGNYNSSSQQINFEYSL